MMMMKLSNRQKMSRKKGEKKTGESHACGQTREEVCMFESDIFLFSLFFQFNLSLVGTEASPFGGRHHFTCLDVDPPTMPT